MDSDSYAEELQDHSAFPRLCPQILNAKNYDHCQWAKTVTGLDPNTEKYVVISVTCKRWGCPYCAIRKIRRLAWMTKNAAPTRLLTTTIAGPDSADRVGRYPDGKSAWDATSKAFPELIRYCRKIWGEVEYMRVLELQNNGMPHFHAMVRSGFLPHKPVHTEWKRLIGAPEDYVRGDGPKKQWAGLNIEKIDKSFGTFRYLVKYLTKLHKIPWTDRHVSYSSKFFRDEDKEPVIYSKLDDLVKYDVHPYVWLNERYPRHDVIILGEGKWEIQGPPCEKLVEVSPESLGLPGGPAAERVMPMKQRMVPGLEEAAVQDDDGTRADGSRARRRRTLTANKEPVKLKPVFETPF